jgi:hypothetical protein
MFLTAGATVLAGLASFIFGITAKPSAGLGVRGAMSAAPILLFVTFVGTLVAIVQVTRRAVVSTIGDDANAAEQAATLAMQLGAQLNGVAIGGYLACIAALAAVLGAAMPWMRHDGARGAVGATALGAAGALVATFFMTERYITGVIIAFGAVANESAQDRAALLDRGMLEAAPALGLARIAAIGSIAVFGALAAVLAARAARRGHVAGIGAWIAAVAMLAIGGGAYALTRDIAYDNAHPIAPSGSPFSYEMRADAPDLPRCAPVELPLPVIDISERGVVLDGRRMDTETFAQDLATLARHWDVLHPREPFHRAIAVSAPASTPVSSIAPWLATARDAGYRDVHILSPRVSTISTRSWGELVRRGACSVRVTLDPEGTRAGRYRTWNELARAASSGELERLAP